MTAALGTHKIETARDEAIHHIAEYVSNQLTLWGQIPAWALRARHPNKPDATLEQAYEQRCWPVNNLAIDCTTGDIVSIGSPGVIAAPHEIIQLAFHLEQLNASQILAGLQARAKDHNPLTDWHKATAKDLNLTEELDAITSPVAA
jgi:hypothetical protein